MMERTLDLPRRRYGPDALRTEFGAMLALALPLALTQLGQILIHGTEVLLLGRLAPAKLAAVTIGWSLFHICFMFAIGTVQATAPAVAQARGARQPRQVRRAVRQGLWLALAVTLPMGLLLWFSRPIFLAIGQDPALLDDTMVYLRAIALGLPFGAGYIVLRCFVAAYGRTAAVMIVTYAAFLVNIPLSYGLIFGAFGLPRLEVLGAGIGAAVSWALMFFGLLGYCLMARPFRRFVILGRFWRSDWATFKELWRIGLPIGLAVVMESGLFSAATLMVGLVGTAALAAHQVTLQLGATAFMVPLGIGIAATIRVGLAVGAGDADGVRRAGWVAAGLGAAFMAGIALLFWTLGETMIGWFFDHDQPGTAATITMAVGFIKIAAIFALADGLQVIGISNLRGMKDTAVPMWIAGFGYWVIGFPAAAMLTFGTPLAGRGVWVGLALALATVAVAMLWRFHRLTAPGRLERRLGLSMGEPGG
jgi:multidrug resistance protein, MATE family